MDIVEHGLYIISDEFFKDFPDPYLKDNTGNKRPHFYCVRDRRTGLLWVIPFTSSEKKLAKIRQWIQYKPDLFHLTCVSGRDGSLLIGDSFPITEKYFDHEYTVDGIHYIFKDESEIKEIHGKLFKVLALRRRRTKFSKTDPDVLAIEKHLLAGTTMTTPT